MFQTDIYIYINVIQCICILDTTSVWGCGTCSLKDKSEESKSCGNWNWYIKEHNTLIRKNDGNTLPSLQTLSEMCNVSVGECTSLNYSD